MPTQVVDLEDTTFQQVGYVSPKRHGDAAQCRSLKLTVLTLSKYRSTMSRPQKVHTHLPGSAATAGTEDEDEESDDGE